MMGLGYNSFNTFTPFMPYQIGFGGLGYSGSSAKTETSEEAEIRTRKEKADKAAKEFMQRMEAIKNNALIAEKEDKETPLTASEKKALIKEGLKLEEEEIEKSETTLASSMLFTTPFLIPTLKSAIKPKKNTVQMFYKNGASHMDLFGKNPDLMINAQETMQKLERKIAKDFKAAKGNKALIKNIADERKLFRTMMENALKTNDPHEIAKVTEQLNVAKGVKNGRFSRWYRMFKKRPQINSRFDAVMTAESAGKFSSVKPPKAGASFLKNLCSNKSMWIMSAVMAVVPVMLDWANIKKASAIDKENEQKGKSTNYGNQQILQTGLKSGGSILTYSITDTLARTAAKKYLGKFAAKFAAKIAVKGGCKILGSAVGSFIPGFGTVAGLLAGTAADYLLNKYVFANMDFFKNSSVKKAELNSGTDEELLNQISEQYSMGNNICNKKLLSLLKRKCGEENFARIQQMHDMSEDERNQYLTKLQEEQAILAQQAQQQQMQQTASAA